MYDYIVHCYRVFEKHGVDDPLRETLHLFDVLMHGALRRVDLSSMKEQGINLEDVARKCREGMTIEYILGRATFMGLDLVCTQETLIPRQETELLARVALGAIDERLERERTVTVIDVGTGCGNLALSIAVNRQRVRVLASDISPGAVAVAQENVRRLGVEDRVSVHCGDLLAPFADAGYAGRVDVIMCNPPYIPTNSLERLDPEIIDYEPRVALDAGSYGIDIFRRLINEAVPILCPGGFLVFEIGAGQDKLVTRLFQRNGAYQDIQHYDDGIQVRVMGATRGWDGPHGGAE